jgi:hypothetical protein
MTNPKCIACGVELEVGWTFAHCGRKECSVLRRKECPYCKRSVDEHGGINHVGGCTGLQDIPMNRLQYDILRGNLSLAEEGLASYALEVERLKATIMRVKQARLDWAMVCECTCAACETFSNVIRLIGRSAVEPTPDEPCERLDPLCNCPVNSWGKVDCQEDSGIVRCRAEVEAESEGAPRGAGSVEPCHHEDCHAAWRCTKCGEFRGECPPLGVFETKETTSS